MFTTQGSLLDRLRHPGDQPSWDRFVQLYTPLLFHWARRLGAQDADAADLVQEVFTILVQKLPGFHYEPSRRFRGWLWTVILNTRRMLLRRDAAAPRADWALVEQCLAVEDDAAEQAEYQQYLIGRVLQLMQANFQPKIWKACWEHVISNRQAADVAAELNMSVGAVYVAKSRVLRRLREELGELLD